MVVVVVVSKGWWWCCRWAPSAPCQLIKILTNTDLYLANLCISTPAQPTRHQVQEGLEDTPRGAAGEEMRIRAMRIFKSRRVCVLRAMPLHINTHRFSPLLSFALLCSPLLSFALLSQHDILQTVKAVADVNMRKKLVEVALEQAKELQAPT
jgi:hypothetical protein